MWRGALQAVRVAGALLAVGLVTVPPAPVEAQWGDILSLQEGDSLRLRLPGALRVAASMRGMRQDTLLLKVGGIDQEWPVSGFDLVSLERFGDRTPQEGLRHGAVLGMVGGLFAGAAAGVVFDAIGGNDEGEATVRILSSSLKWAGLGAAGGTVFGAVMGGRRPGRGWVALELPVR